MSARRVADSGFSLPPNPSYIDFPRTDGSPSTWPPNTTRVVDHEGHVNFYQHVDLDHHQNKKWRASVGDAVSLGLKMPGTRTRSMTASNYFDFGSRWTELCFEGISDGLSLV